MLRVFISQKIRVGCHELPRGFNGLVPAAVCQLGLPPPSG